MKNTEDTRAIVATVSRKLCKVLNVSFENFPLIAQPDQYTPSSCSKCGDDTWLGIKTAALVKSGMADELCIICTREEAGDDEPITPIDQVPKTTCPRCHKTSFNHNDVREKYCGNCHAFYHDQV